MGDHRPAFPQLSWLGYHRDLLPDRRQVITNRHQCIKVVVHVDAHVEWTSGTMVRRYCATTGGIGIWPADGAEHRFLVTAPRPARSIILLIPPQSLAVSAAIEGIDGAATDCPRYEVFDAGLRSAVLEVAGEVIGGHGESTGEHEDRFHHLALRLVELMTGRRPDWHRDHAQFTEPILRRIISGVDDNLAVPPALMEFAAITGLSPGHFTRKFRASCGMSLGRFIHQRRIRRALDRIRSPVVSLSHLALELGFDSQSHFTRVFRSLTGMTPGRFRRQLIC